MHFYNFHYLLSIYVFTSNFESMVHLSSHSLETYSKNLSSFLVLLQSAMGELYLWFAQCLHCSTWRKLGKNYLTRTSSFIWNESFQTFDLCDCFLALKYFSFLIFGHHVLPVFLLPVWPLCHNCNCWLLLFYNTSESWYFFSGLCSSFSFTLYLNSIPKRCHIVPRVSVLPTL